MPKTIAINGTKLSEVRMLSEPYSDGCVTYLLYPANQIHFSREGRTLSLAIPANLGVELYRTGILPQDVDTPVEISIGGRSAGRYLVTDVRYPSRRYNAFEEVIFRLTLVLEGSSPTGVVRPPSRANAAARGALVADITHYFGEDGGLARMPRAAIKLATFLSLVIEAATGDSSHVERDSGVRCRIKSCGGEIRTFLPLGGNEISWYCPRCERHGVIRNWQNTKWNRRKPVE
jgi:hypothetical protein